MVEEVEEEVSRIVSEGRGGKRWRYGKKKWWTWEVEKKYRGIKEVEREWERGGRERGRNEVNEKRREWRELLSRVKGE